MKKILSLLIFIVCFMVIGCGNSPEKEAKSLYEKYAGDTGKYAVAFADFQHKLFEIQDNEDQQKTLELVKSSLDKMTNVVNEIEREKVYKENEKFKEALYKKIKVREEMLVLFKGAVESYISEDYQALEEISRKQKIVKSSLNDIDFNFENEYCLATTGEGVKLINYKNDSYLAKVASDVMLAVADVEFSDEALGNEYMSVSPLGKFAIVKVLVVNNQKDAITVNSSSFKLIDRDGNIYSNSSKGQMYYDMENDSDNGFLTTLNPNMGRSFTFIFDVPQNMIITDLRLQAKGGFTGEKVILKLGAIKKPK